MLSYLPRRSLVRRRVRRLLDDQSSAIAAVVAQASCQLSFNVLVEVRASPLNVDQSDFSPQSPACQAHGCKSSLCSHLCALTTPEPSECHTRSPASVWQRNAAACDSSPVWQFSIRAPPSSPLAAKNSRPCDVAADLHHLCPADRARDGAKEKHIASTIPVLPSDICAPAHPADKPHQNLPPSLARAALAP